MTCKRAFFILISALLLAGCFDPDYGEGNFSCKDNGCPEGYGCVPEGNSWRCQKGAKDVPKDWRLDTDHKDGGVEDASDTPFQPKNQALTCHSITKINLTKALNLTPASWDLALDYANLPYLVYVTKGGEIMVSYLTKDKNWITSKAGSGSRAAAAVDSQHHLSIAYVSGSKVMVMNEFIDTTSTNPLPTGAWSETMTLHDQPGGEVKDLDLDAYPGETALPWYVIHAEDKDSKGVVVEGRMGRVTDKYTVGKKCTRPPTSAAHPAVAAGWIKGDSTVEAAVTSYFGLLGTISKKGWQLAYHKESDTKTCEDLTTVECDGGCLDHQGRLAMDTGGLVHAVISKVNHNNRGQLDYETWNGKKTFGGETVIGMSVVNPKSLDIDVDLKGRPCISFFANGMAGRLTLRVACNRGGTSMEWLYSQPVFEVPRAAFKAMEQSEATSTRVSISKITSDGKVHVAFTAAEAATKPTLLRYFTCDLPTS